MGGEDEKKKRTIWARFNDSPAKMSITSSEQEQQKQFVNGKHYKNDLYGKQNAHFSFSK